MILSLICLSAQQSLNAADYFPCSPGLVRTYQEKKSHTLMVNKVGDALDMGGTPVYPITQSNGGAVRPTYYRIEQGSVSIVAYDLKHPLPDPMPVLKIAKDEVAWEFHGKTATGPEGEMLRETAKAHLGGTRTILGQKVDVLVVEMRAVRGLGASGVRYQQETIYAKGMGAVEIKTSAWLGSSKKSFDETYELISIEPAK
jgi:hypothetical protein